MAPAKSEPCHTQFCMTKPIYQSERSSKIQLPVLQKAVRLQRSAHCDSAAYQTSQLPKAPTCMLNWKYSWGNKQQDNYHRMN